ncbi:competence type IV pilus minor pilin ComGF [Clostridium uliginosum]|uniref:Putative Competence protein ComGF n=1 Tax=Clostridium uliginosum TaxID=119641 RepID=A0A1I1NLQ1_9CLOT|nr:competence type IV pilus minor pilin ComGF [Clostridium uliginosum]SFC96408.1 Putative Competence protein ComGF [Clostridium uliginosum]
MRKEKGFTIIESIIYIFLTTIILFEGISMVSVIYKGYIENESISINYNDMQSFYINLDSILKEEDIEDVEVGDGYLLISRNMDSTLKSKKIIKDKDCVVVKYLCGNYEVGTNVLLLKVSDFKVVNKENLIYIIVTDKNGEDFIRCL